MLGVYCSARASAVGGRDNSRAPLIEFLGSEPVQNNQALHRSRNWDIEILILSVGLRMPDITNSRREQLHKNVGATLELSVHPWIFLRNYDFYL